MSVVDSVAIKTQPRSGFDKSHKNILTAKVGTLVPLLHDLILPNSDVFMRLAIAAALPPLASETYMRASYKVEAFFCPLRLLYGGFESWLTGSEMYSGVAANTAVPFRAQMPRLKFEGTDATFFGLGTLSDYLGVQIDANTFQSQNQEVYVNVLPYVCYHLIWDSWYRNTKVQKPLFTRPGVTTVGSASQSGQLLRVLPYVAFDTIRDFLPSNTFFDSVALGSLRQRNYGSDYFTTATPNAQLGQPMTVQTDPNTGLFSIAALRSANSLQIWEEMQNLTGVRIQDYCKVNYGARLGSGVAQRPLYLGSASYPVYSKGVYSSNDVQSSNNPFTTVGARYGSAYAQGTDFVIKAHFDEPGILMVIGSLVPEANYTHRVSAVMRKFIALGSLVDLPNPMLQNVGNEPIMESELDADCDMGAQSENIFGYVPRFTWIKTMPNEVHGLLCPGGSLSSFVSHRYFANGTQISSAFLQIPTNALDNVTAVTADLSNYGVWIDSFFDYKVSMPLSRYSLPSLQNPAYEHGISHHVHVGGSKID